MKELMLWKKFFPDVIAAQNESPYSIKEKTIKYINKHYETVYTAFDADEAGSTNTSYYLDNYGYRGIDLPKKAIKKYDIKDWAEFVQHYNLETMEAYLKHIKLL